jgi:uncharacterized metal-binding protein YceD (DUF177 family)
MSKAVFVVPLADLERGPRIVSWSISHGWLTHALEGTDATAVGDGRLEVSVTKTGRDVLVRGSAQAHVTVPDSRTLQPVELDLKPDIFLMLSPASDDGPRPKRGRKGKSKLGPTGKPPTRGWPDDGELSDENAAVDTYAGEQVTLDPFVREFLLLEMPMVVHSSLRSDPSAAIAPVPSPEESPPDRPVDPRLAPLAQIRDRLTARKGEK